MARFPNTVERLFWDVDPDSLDLTRHADYVLERVMSRGGWEAMSWLRAAYSREQLADFLERKGERLTPRDLAYWCLVAGVDRVVPRGGGRRAWAGP